MKQIIIGKVNQKIDIYKGLFLGCIISIIAGYGCYIYLTVSELVPGSSSIIMSVFACLLILMAFIPNLCNDEYIIFKEDSVHYYHETDIKKQIQTIIDVLNNKERTPTYSLDYKLVDSLKLTSHEHTGNKGTIKYRLKFTFYLKDNQAIYMYPTSLDQMSSNDYLEAINLITNSGITLIDEEQLSLHLSNGKEDFYNYCSQLHKK